MDRYPPEAPLRRPVLRPGLRVLRRGPAQLQVGLDPRLAVLLEDNDAVRRTLATLSVAGAAADADPNVLDRLQRAGSVVEQEALARCRGGRVELLGFGAVPLPEVAPLIDRVGLQRIDPARSPVPAEVGLIVGVGEPDRDLLDTWVRDGLPHLALRISEGIATVGPFVDPGRTACLRCVDAHHADADSRWPLLVAQQAAQTERPRPDGVPDPADPTLVAIASGWAVRDLLSHLAGRTPATWSATLRLTPDLAETESVSWLRHPECGCSWNQAGSVASRAGPR